MDESEILQEVPSSEISKVLEILKKDWPKHFLLHQYITIMEHYRTCKTNILQKLYKCGTLEEGVYVVKTSYVIKERLQPIFFIYTLSKDLTPMLKALMETSRIPWITEPMFVFEITFNIYAPLVIQAAASKGLTLSQAENYMMWYPPEKEINLRPLPDDVCLKLLDENHVPEIDKNWPHRYPGSHEYLAQQIKNNFGIGLFVKSNNKMLSSALHFHSGGIFVLFTDEENRGKGYAEIIVCNMVKEIRQRGRIPFCTILKENIPSQKLFRKIGFQEFTSVNFIFPNH